MQNGLTKKDMQRISEFLATSEYERTPEQLMPDDAPDVGPGRDDS